MLHNFLHWSCIDECLTLLIIMETFGGRLNNGSRSLPLFTFKILPLHLLIESGQGSMGDPELGWVADLLGKLQGDRELSLCL
jgi:hypothetical protein